ncbi:MAG: hypothetical protein HY903_21090 [Deltaproteobacteria bacterium]|nr:hypothetical protein [Deltaproteobacteria bacterium]
MGALLVTLLLGGSERWLHATPEPSPVARGGAVVAYDEARDVVVIYGGASGGMLVNEVWEHDGSRWQVSPAVNPSARAYGGMAFDPGLEKVVMFGGWYIDPGATTATVLSDTWAFDGDVWQQLASGGPVPRELFALAYDRDRERLLLFGGFGVSTPSTPTGELGDTWTFDGSSWTSIYVTGPAARVGAAMAFDEAQGEMVLFGGYSGIEYFADTWAFDGAAWRQRSSEPAPPARAHHSMVYDPERARVILHGGQYRFMSGDKPQHADLGDVWEWDGDRWEETTPDQGPAARRFASLAFDRGRRRALLYGGVTDATPLGDTWEYLKQRSHLSCAATGDGMPFAALAVLGLLRRAARRADATPARESKQVQRLSARDPE